MAKDYYQILGVAKNASEGELKSAYRKLAREYHPDRHPGDKQAEERFKEVNEAYEVLSDPDKRKAYDRFGPQFEQYQRAGAGGANWGPGARVNVDDLDDLFGSGGFSDIFSSIFGGRTQTRRARGQNIEHPISIDLEEAFHGTRVTLEKDGKHLEVNIPRGVKSGSKVRVTGEGSPGAGGAPNGDLFLVVDVKPHARLMRDGDHLRAEQAVDLYTAILGGEVDVPTLEGTLSLKVPPETQDGRTFKLSGQGMPNLQNPKQRGDLLVKLHIHIPQNLTDRERQLFQELARLRSRR
jgi:curved DNA-binding protein